MVFLSLSLLTWRSALANASIALASLPGVVSASFCTALDITISDEPVPPHHDARSKEQEKELQLQAHNIYMYPGGKVRAITLNFAVFRRYSA